MLQFLFRCRLVGVPTDTSFFLGQAFSKSYIGLSVMEMQYLVPVSDFLQSLTVVIALAAYLPQWQTLYRNKSSQNISLKAWVLWTVSGICTWFYAYVQYHTYGTGQMLLITSTLGMFFLFATLALLWRYRVVPQQVPIRAEN